MGHVTREQALVCLQNCPLLADLAEWSHWDVVFRPALKDLKDFIHKHGGVYQCTTLGKVSSMYCTMDRSVCSRSMSVNCCTRYEDQGVYRSWKVMEFKIQIFQAWKVMELRLGPGKS